MIQRYDGVWWEMGEHVEGNYVTYEDHAAEVARLEAVVQDLQDAMRTTSAFAFLNCRVIEYHQLKEDFDQLNAVNAKLVEALEDALDSWQFGESTAEGRDSYDKARAALALAKGEA